MNGVIGELLPLALGIAISPIPIIAAILMLLSPRARTNSIGFAIGWTAGVALATVVFTLLSSLIAQPAGGPSPLVGWVKIVLGVLLVLLAVAQWRKRPRPGHDVASPQWMAAIDTMSAAQACGLGFVLSAANPKNLMMAVSAGVTIGTARLGGGAVTIAILVFVILSITTVAVPVIAFLVAPGTLERPLGRLREWLTANNAVVMCVLLLLIGVVSIGKGIAAI